MEQAHLSTDFFVQVVDAHVRQVVGICGHRVEKERGWNRGIVGALFILSGSQSSIAARISKLFFPVTMFSITRVLLFLVRECILSETVNFMNNSSLSKIIGPNLQRS